jgi:flagellar motility protein MotE (MotC chaperone)
MNRQYRRKLEKEREKEYKLFVKKNKNFLDSIKGEEGTQQTLERIKDLLDNFQQEPQDAGTE